VLLAADSAPWPLIEQTDERPCREPNPYREDREEQVEGVVRSALEVHGLEATLIARQHPAPRGFYVLNHLRDSGGGDWFAVGAKRLSCPSTSDRRSAFSALAGYPLATMSAFFCCRRDLALAKRASDVLDFTHNRLLTWRTKCIWPVACGKKRSLSAMRKLQENVRHLDVGRPFEGF